MQKLQDSFDGTFTDNIRSITYKNQLNNKKHKMVVNVNETQYAVVKHIAKKNKWLMQTDPVGNLNFDLCWTDYHVKPELFARMQPHQKINHFPGMGILSRKNNLGNALMSFRKKFPGDFEFFPITWSLPTQYPDLQAYHQCRQQGKAQTFIVKPEASCQGRGIYLTRNIEKIKYDRCVVQRYMHKPYLIDNLKFDLRIYVLISGIDPLRIFVYQQGLARFATEQYRAPRSENLDNKFMHLTNYAINKQSPNFVFNQDIDNMNIGHKRSLTSVYKRMEQDGHNVEELKQKINDLFIKTIITGYPTLSASVTNVHPDNFGNDMCFEVLGFDVMVDHKLNPVLLEINYTPSFTADTPLDRHIKKNLISDTLTLINATEKWKKEMKNKRDKEIQERMMSGKRKKYTPEERKVHTMQQARKRNQYQINNKGKYTKIFMLSQEQFNQYRQFYDYSMELFNASQKIDSNGSVIFSRPLGKQFPNYQNYFQLSRVKKDKVKKNEKENMKNNSRIGKEYRDTDMGRSGQNQVSFIGSNSNKRVSSAKSRQQKKQRKVVYQRIPSKKSLKNQQYSRNNNQSDKTDDFLQNASIFTNKNIQKLILKQKSHDRPGEPNDQSFSNDFNS